MYNARQILFSPKNILRACIWEHVFYKNSANEKDKIIEYYIWLVCNDGFSISLIHKDSSFEFAKRVMDVVTNSMARNLTISFDIWSEDFTICIEDYPASPKK